MTFARRLITLAGGVALPLASAGADDPALDERALAVIERTKAVDATYSNYMWNRLMVPDGRAREEWSAEFHSGSKHRVETPRDRLVADCHAMSGTAVSLESGETISGPQVAAAGCGINTNKAFRSARLISRVKGRFGMVDRVEVSDRDNVRVYDVTQDGIIVGTTYAGRMSPSSPDLQTWTVTLESRVPSDGMFSEESLSRSFLPASFTTAPDAVAE